MKKTRLQVPFRWLLSGLLLAVLMTVPTTAAGSKYVWRENIDLKLEIQYSDTILTSVFLSQNSARGWTLQLTNLQGIILEEGLYLVPEEGYTLPETMTLSLGEACYTIYTNGLNNPSGITFDSATNILSVEDNLLTEAQGKVVVVAEGQPEHSAVSDGLEPPEQAELEDPVNDNEEGTQFPSVEEMDPEGQPETNVANTNPQEGDLQENQASKEGSEQDFSLEHHSGATAQGETMITGEQP